MIQLDTPLKQVLGLVLSLVLLAVAGWSIFGPGELTLGTVSAVLGRWEPDPDGVPAALERMGIKDQGEQAAQNLQKLIAAAINEKMSLVITEESVIFTIAEKTTTTSGHLRAQPAYHIDFYNPQAPTAIGMLFQTTSRGMLVPYSTSVIPMHRIRD